MDRHLSCFHFLANMNDTSLIYLCTSFGLMYLFILGGIYLGVELTCHMVTLDPDWSHSRVVGFFVVCFVICLFLEWLDWINSVKSISITSVCSLWCPWSDSPPFLSSFMLLSQFRQFIIFWSHHHPGTLSLDILSWYLNGSSLGHLNNLPNCQGHVWYYF